MDAEETYFQQCAHHILLSPEKEIELLTRAKTGDISARDELVSANQRLVIKLARKLSCLTGDNELCDLIQFGNIGLLEAINRFDTKRGTRFSTYAVWWIAHYIRQKGQRSGSNITKSYGQNERIRKVNNVRREIYSHSGQEATVDEIASRLNLSIKQVSLTLENTMPVLSLDRTKKNCQENPESLIDTTSDNKPPIDLTIEKKDTIERIYKLLDTFSFRSRTIFKLYYGLDGETLTLQQIANRLHISKQRVDQILHDIRAFLRSNLKLNF